jgi:hypothetical protein
LWSVIITNFWCCMTAWQGKQMFAPIDLTINRDNWDINPATEYRKLRHHGDIMGTPCGYHVGMSHMSPVYMATVLGSIVLSGLCPWRYREKIWGWSTLVSLRNIV